MNIHSIIDSYLNNKINRKITMNIHKEQILKLIKQEKVITSSELAKYLKISWNTAEKYLLEMALEGKVELIKKEGVNLWLLK